MSPRAFYKPRAAGSLKEAVAELVLACGGQVEAARLCRVSKSQIARYTDDSGDNETAHIPADVVACLEVSCGQPIVTAYLASLTRHALIDLAPVTLTKPYAVLLSEIGRDDGKLFAEAAAALLDGRLDARESGRVRKRALELYRALSALIAHIDAGRE